MEEPLPLTDADLAIVQAQAALMPCNLSCRMVATGRIVVTDPNGNVVFGLSRGEGGFVLAHCWDDPEAPEAGFREEVVADLAEALAMMREMMAKD
ncbi:MAG TPA: hypothetical protein VMA37_15470 [Acetobacteraceae bacterium]|nr:hypothetical protein [Acetobacteraceae bacterium]